MEHFAKKSTVFIGSSTPGLPVAEVLQANLHPYLDVTIWNQDVFGVGEFTMETLVNAAGRFDFAILVFSADDKLESAGRKWMTPRDNVLLEFGFFLGTLGRQRTFIVHEAEPLLKLPTDINGITTLSYPGPAAAVSSSSLGAVCIKIRNAISREMELQAESNRLRMGEKADRVRGMIENSLKVVCRALARTSTPEDARLRAFIFTKVGNHLVCSNFWSPRPTSEARGIVKFPITPESERDVVVVRAAMQKKVCAEPIVIPPSQLTGAEGEIDKDLCFVLAAPILSPGGEVLGTVDFDASSKKGEQILRNEISHNVIFELGQLLHVSF